MHAGRILARNYMPTEDDILNFSINKHAFYETFITMGGLSIRMTHMPGDRDGLRKIRHLFENITAVIFTVDLACYDQVLPENAHQNRLMEELFVFEAMVNNRWLTRSSILLFLGNVNLLSEKLSQSPFQNHFPDYCGGSDVNDASKYILSLFNRANKSNHDLYPHLVEFSDLMNMQLVLAALKDTVIQNRLNRLLLSPYY